MWNVGRGSQKEKSGLVERGRVLAHLVRRQTYPEEGQSGEVDDEESLN